MIYLWMRINLWLWPHLDRYLLAQETLRLKETGWMQKECFWEDCMPVLSMKLLGVEGLVADDYPGVGPFLDAGRIGFRAHEGGHTVAPNWEYFIDFAKNYF